MTTAQSVSAPVFGGVLFNAVPPLPRWYWWLRVIASATLGCAFFYVVLIGYLWSNESRILYMTRNSRFVSAPDPVIFQAGRLRTADGVTLKRVILKHDASPDGYWILFCMPAGGSTDLPHLQNQLQRLWSFDYNVLAFDYRGFGQSSGRPTEDGLYLDATTAYAYLTRELHVPSDRVILAGRSLGSAVALDLATRVQAAGLVLFSPIDSVPMTAARLYPWAPVRQLVTTSFDNVAKASRVTVPVVLTYGYGDDLVPKAVARALFSEFGGPKQMLETNGGHHFSGFERFSELFAALDRFWPVARKS